MDIDLQNLIASQKEPLIFVISGLSAAGKDTAIQRLLGRGLPLYCTVNANTRPRRTDEEEGVDYFFMSEEEYFAHRDQGDFFEYSDVYRDKKGILRREILKGLGLGMDVILRVDVQGAVKVRQKCPEAVLIFISTDSLDEQARRLSERGTEDQASLDARTRLALKELSYLPEFDYLVVNYLGQVDRTADQLAAIITSEHLHATPRRICLDKEGE